MNNLETWQRSNEDYLAAALQWLRLELSLMIKKNGGSTESSPEKEDGTLAWLGMKMGIGNEKDNDPADLSHAKDEMESAESLMPPPALIMLSRLFGLNEFEKNVLLLCASTEMDTRIAGLCAQAQDDPARPYPTFALAFSLFDDPNWDILSPERPLRYWQILEISRSGQLPLTNSPLRADDRIVSYIKGLNYLDERVRSLLMPFELSEESEDLPPSQLSAVDEIASRIAGVGSGSPVIELLGHDGQTKQMVARRAAEELGLNLYRLPADLLPPNAVEMDLLARLWQRESILLPIALYLDAQDSVEQAPAIRRFLSRMDVNGVIFLASRDILEVPGRDLLIQDISKPTSKEQREAWETALGEESSENSALLAGQFDLNLSTINRIARSAFVDGQISSKDRIWDECLSCTRPRMEALAQRIDPRATWDQIVIPKSELALLNQISDQVRHRYRVYDVWGFGDKMNRGLGISTLFSGESGTGKTMAAEVLANDLRMSLYRIDLSAVVSKYIGETEKNLRRLFDAAEDGGAILFFDEADSLFGKRSEVKDSHDRYANIEVNYLLQRIETFKGLAILATNTKGALDSAFLRRLRFVVNFPFPGQAERRAIWEKTFPEKMPHEELDFERLAKLNLTGGSIHNIAINAAFISASSGAPLNMPMIFEAARAELRKLERPVNEADFR